MDSVNEHAIDAEYDQTACNRFVTDRPTSNNKPPLPQPLRRSVDFGSVRESLETEEDELRMYSDSPNEDFHASNGFNRTIRIKDGIRKSLNRVQSVLDRAQTNNCDHGKTNRGLDSPGLSRSPSTPELRDSQNLLDSVLDSERQRSLSEQCLRMDLLPVRALGSTDYLTTNSPLVGRVQPGLAALSCPGNGSLVGTTDDIAAVAAAKPCDTNKHSVNCDRRERLIDYGRSGRTGSGDRSRERSRKSSTHRAEIPAVIGPDGMLLQGVRLYARGLQLTWECYQLIAQAQTDLVDRSFVRPGVVNLNACATQGKPLFSVRSATQISRSTSRSKSRSASRPRDALRRSRSRSASPHLRHSQSTGQRKSEHPLALTLEVSVPIQTASETSSPTNWMTTSLEFHKDSSRSRDPQVPDFVGSGRKHRSVRFKPTHHRLLQPIAQLAMNDAVHSHKSPDEYTRFRLFTRTFAELAELPPHTPDPSQTAGPAIDLIGLNNLTLDELKLAISTKTYWRSSPRARLFVHLFQPGSGPVAQPERSGSPRSASGLIRARLEIEVEPIWRPASRNPASHWRYQPDPQRKPCPMHTSTIAPIALETLLSISHGRRLHLFGPEANRSAKTPLHASQTCGPLASINTGPVSTKFTPPKSIGASVPVEHTYLIIRLPWCQTTNPKSSGVGVASHPCRFNSAVAWMGGSCPSYKFALRTPCVLDAEMLTRLSRSFAVIEVWVKMTTGQPDALLGLAKIPTDTLVTVFAFVDARTGGINMHSDEIITALMTSMRPVIVSDTWQPVIDPFSGAEQGQLRIRLAVGTSSQIESLHFGADSSAPEDGPHSGRGQGTGWQALDLIRWPENQSGQDQNQNQYGTQCHSLSRHRTPVQLLMASSLEALTGAQQLNRVSQSPLVSCEFSISTHSGRKQTGSHTKLGSSNPDFLSYWNRTHQLSFCLRQTSDRTSRHESHKTVSDHVGIAQHHGFVQWLLDVLSQDWSEEAQMNWPRGIPLELWLRIYSPNLRDCLVARGWISADLLNQLVRQQSIDAESQLRCTIPLRDLHTERVNGSLDIRLTYRFALIMIMVRSEFIDMYED
ncbi:unnamed protein product [Echinostoma caproni]|uniref:Uncharacterized protein n=1 Tax=Echinostoma caproni TaxID=27848 RepID=A0A183ALT1_9TREM|nr:unnamed protein product [Echinostoma caproni]